jgi:hypothetical protein
MAAAGHDRGIRQSAPKRFQAAPVRGILEVGPRSRQQPSTPIQTRTY